MNHKGHFFWTQYKGGKFTSILYLDVKGCINVGFPFSIAETCIWFVRLVTQSKCQCS